MNPCFNLGLRFATSFNYLSPKAGEASDGGRRHETRRRLFPRELILQGKARSDDTDKLGADFMAAPPDHLVCAFPGQHRAGQEQHEFIGSVETVEAQPHAAVILCTADHDKVDDRTRSKWSRVLRYAAERKDLDEPPRDFNKRRAASTNARRGLRVALGARNPQR